MTGHPAASPSVASMNVRNEENNLNDVRSVKTEEQFPKDFTVNASTPFIDWSGLLLSFVSLSLDNLGIDSKNRTKRRATDLSISRESTTLTPSWNDWRAIGPFRSHRRIRLHTGFTQRHWRHKTYAARERERERETERGREI